MESFVVLVLLFFIVGPIVLFFLVFGARSRIQALEKTVLELREELRLLRRQAGANQLVESAPVAPSANAQLPGESTGMPSQPAAEVQSFPEVAPAPVAVFNADPESAPAAGQVPRQFETSSPPLPPSVESLTYQSPPSVPPEWLAKAKEWLFGGNLVAKVGLLILFIGVGFLLKYAAEHAIVPIELRLAGVVAASIGLLLWGWRIRESRPAISLPVQGAALGIMMLVTFSAFRMYNLIPGGLAFGLLFGLTAFTCVLALLQDALWLAVFGIVGGFAAPILTSTGHGSHVTLFSYYALLNAGILAIALKQSWRLLNLLGFAFTFVIATAWGVLSYEPRYYASVQGFLILFFVFYVVIAALYAHRQAPQLRHYVDGTLVFGTPLLAFALQYGIVRDYSFGLAFSALAMALFYATLTLTLWRRRGDTLRLLVESFLALAIVFGTLTIPLALDGRWTSAAWALEGAGIVWVGLRQQRKLAWGFGVLVQVGAWVSYLLSVGGLAPHIARESNLWLGFLLLAGSGFVMAWTFRHEGLRDADEMPASPVVPFLATLFLGMAAVWLLAGAWVEIFLRGGRHAHTLLVFSAMGVAAILGQIASRLDWPVSRYFSLAPQVLAGAVFLVLFDQGLLWGRHPVNSNLFETGFLGGLLIALGAMVSALAFHRQEDEHSPLFSRALLAWSGFWWFAVVLASFDVWGAQWLAIQKWFVEPLLAPVHPVYCLLVALGAPGFALLARRLDWPDLRWLAAAVWPALLIVLVQVLRQLDVPAPHLPAWPLWAAFLILWLGSEWLLRDGWPSDESQTLPLCAIHTLRSGAPWLLIWPTGYHLVTFALHTSDAQQAALMAQAGWVTSGSWARYLPAWAMMGCLGGLIRQARLGVWPTAPVADWYRNVLIPLGAGWSVLLAAFWNLTQNGRMEPLPYLPILNPLDLTTGFAALLALAAWRLRTEATEAEPVGVHKWLWAVLGGAAFLWFNLMLLRTAAHFLDLPYRFDTLFRSQFIQAMLSLVWSATALVLMRFAADRRTRSPWLAGAGLLGLVVVKLFFVDLSSVGSVERIVSFVGVGLLMLAISYLAPFPAAESSKEA